MTKRNHLLYATTILTGLTLCGDWAAAGPNMPNMPAMQMPNISPPNIVVIRPDISMRGPNLLRERPEVRTGASLRLKGALANAHKLRKVNQFRDAAAVAREASKAMRLSIPVTRASGDGPFKDPLAQNTENTDPDAMRHWTEMRRRFGLGVSSSDGFDLLDRASRNLSHNRTSWDGTPGLRLDTNSIPGVSASQGGTEPGNPDDTVDKMTNADGSVTVRTSHTDEDGARTTTETEYRSGQVVVEMTSWHDSGSTVWYTNHEYASGHYDIWWGSAQGPTYARGGTVGGPAGPIVQLNRILTGDEGGTAGSWCPPSGWSCKGPQTAASITSGGRRDRPSEEGTPAPAAETDMSRQMAVNPNPDVYAGGDGGAASDRSYDGGRIVNPGPDGPPPR